MSFWHAVAVSESYRIDEFWNARRGRQSRSPEAGGIVAFRTVSKSVGFRPVSLRDEYLGPEPQRGVHDSSKITLNAASKTRQREVELCSCWV
jgi:hypothetical protein